MEWSRLVQTALNSAVLTHLHPRCQIDIFVEVINADGSVLTTSINAITLALIHAGVPMRDYLVATSAIYFAGQRAPNGMTTGAATVVDPNRDEEVAGAPVIRAMMFGRTRQVVSFSVERRLPADRMQAMLSTVKQAGRRIFESLDQSIVRQHTELQRK